MSSIESRARAPRIVLVTGAAGAIGAETCRRFAETGDLVVALDRVAPDAGVCRAHIALVADLADDASMARAAEAVMQAGTPSVVVHAAAATEFATTLDSTPAAFTRIQDVNVGGAVRLVQAFAPGMRAAGAGCFCFVSSINGHFGAPGLSAYAASKGALDTLTRTLALELADDRIRVNAVAPASIDTPMLRASFARQADPDAALARNVLRHPLGRLGTPGDVAGLIAFLCSDAASWITGAIVPVDGGASVARR